MRDIVPLDIFPTMITELSGWTRTLLQRHDSRKDAIRKALQSVANASNETRVYLAKIRDDPRAATAEQAGALARLWTEAGSDISLVSPRLSERFFLKAEYWSDPKGWDSSRRNNLLIDLNDLTESARAALQTL
jgi:hypothetical protein